MREKKFRVYVNGKMDYNFMVPWEEPWINNIFENWSFMQYTGLKDKNGVVIYEGDIVRWGEDGLFEIVFEDAAYSARNPERTCPIFFAEKTMEIVGNIYENPKLLTHKTIK